MRVAHQGQDAIVTLDSRFDGLSAPEVRRCLEELLAEEGARIVLDFAQVDLVDSSGLSVLAWAVKRSRGQNAKVVLAGVGPRIRSVLQITRLDRLLAFEPDLDRALASLAGS